MNQQEMADEIYKNQIINLNEVISNKLDEINKLKFELAVKQNKIEILEMMLKDKKCLIS